MMDLHRESNKMTVWWVNEESGEMHEIQDAEVTVATDLTGLTDHSRHKEHHGTGSEEHYVDVGMGTHDGLTGTGHKALVRKRFELRRTYGSFEMMPGDWVMLTKLEYEEAKARGYIEVDPIAEQDREAELRDIREKFLRAAEYRRRG